jgi:beta-fructofuranosidase
LINLENIEGPFEVQLRQDSLIRYDQGIFELRHGVSGSGRSVRSIEIKDLKQIQVFSDTSSLELFINDGSYVMSSRVYPKQGEDTVVFNGIADIQVQKWDLKKTSK